MYGDTEELILDAALKVFAQEGYIGAKTRLIAEESGFSEMTLFRKFRTKENLFFSLLAQKRKNLLADYSNVLMNNEIKDPIKSIAYLLRNIYNLFEKNFGFISLYFNEKRRISEFILDDFSVPLAEHITLKFPKLKMDILLYAKGVLMSFYYFAFHKYRVYDDQEYEKVIDEVINNHLASLKYNILIMST